MAADEPRWEKPQAATFACKFDVVLSQPQRDRAPVQDAVQALLAWQSEQQSAGVAARELTARLWPLAKTLPDTCSHVAPAPTALPESAAAAGRASSRSVALIGDDERVTLMAP